MNRKHPKLIGVVAMTTLGAGYLYTALMNFNLTLLPIFVAFTGGLFILAGYGYLSSLAFSELLKPRDRFTRLRGLLFSAMFASFITAIPVLVYQYSRLIGQDTEFLRSIANLTNFLNQLFVLLVLIAIFRYTTKQGEE